MNPHHDQRDAEEQDVDDQAPANADASSYIPYAGPRRRRSVERPPVSGGRDARPGDLQDGETAEVGEAQDELAVRPAPAGMTRRDRRDWQISEAERIAAVQDRLRYTDPDRLSAGLASRAPRRLSGKARRAWRESDRSNRHRWWSMQRERNLEQRGAGALVLVLILGGALVWRVTTTDSTSTAQTPAPVTSSSAVPMQSTDGAAPSIGSYYPSEQSSPSGPSRVSISPAVPTSSVPVWSAAPATGVAGIAAAPATGADPATVQTTAAPTDPPTPDELLTPQSAVAAWLARTCPSSWRDPSATGVLTARSAMTAEGWAQSDPAVDTAGAQWWAGVVQRQETRTCGPVDAQVSSLNPAGDTAVVFSTVQRMVTSELPGATATVEDIREARTAARQPDGTWLVGPSTWAG